MFGNNKAIYGARVCALSVSDVSFDKKNVRTLCHLAVRFLFLCRAASRRYDVVKPAEWPICVQCVFILLPCSFSLTYNNQNHDSFFAYVMIAVVALARALFYAIASAAVYFFYCIVCRCFWPA